MVAPADDSAGSPSAPGCAPDSRAPGDDRARIVVGQPCGLATRQRRLDLPLGAELTEHLPHAPLPAGLRPGLEQLPLPLGIARAGLGAANTGPKAWRKSTMATQVGRWSRCTPQIQVEPSPKNAR